MGRMAGAEGQYINVAVMRGSYIEYRLRTCRREETDYPHQGYAER